LLLSLGCICVSLIGCSASEGSKGDVASQNSTEGSPLHSKTGKDSASSSTPSPNPNGVAVSEKQGTDAAPPSETTKAASPVVSEVVQKKSPALPNPLAGGDDGPVRLLVPNKTFQKRGDLIRLSYDDIDLIKILNLKVPDPKVMDLLPEWLKKLDGQKVEMRGFMYPSFQQEDIDRFVFCRDTGACCFGPNPVVYYLINVRMKSGVTTHYIENRPFDVTGTFRIRPGIISETGLVYELYHLEEAVVRER